MVRVFLKGGIWKNSEDEILKAAVQKYGKQQWARVASLLNRKSAKQAKARWYEWLDPSIRKIEWSKAEDDKLLHLAKLMPAQWKTIASIIGRTATQCQEHYEYLLDQAAAAAASGGDGSSAASAAGGMNDLRANTLLRVGQIDSNPESKPARPDPIDMDEDEMEMLQEARARLANTQGKKAKRKQRERMLLAAKRLADLQKRRELKQAGLLSKAALKKSKLSKRQIDYGVEIPFHKPAPAGFHDVTNENVRTEQLRLKRIQNVNYHQVNEQQYRTRDQEAASIRKKEQSRIKMLQKTNDKYLQLMNQAQKQQEPSDQTDAKFIRPLQPLDLPEPTITDTELIQLTKLHQTYQNQNNDTNTMLLLEDNYGGAVPTAALLSDYTTANESVVASMLASVVGTNRDGKQMNEQKPTLMEQAIRLRQLERSTAPLLVTDNVEEDDERLFEAVSTRDREDDDDDDDCTDRKPAARPTSKKSVTEEAGTIASRYSLGAATTTTGTTVLRDQLGINQNHNIANDNAVMLDESSQGGDNRVIRSGIVDDAASVGLSTLGAVSISKYSIRDLARQQRRAAKRARMELENALAALPVPQYEYELAIPTDDMMNDDEYIETSSNLKIVEPDRADVEAAIQEEQRLAAEKLYEARSSVLKRKDLPRPNISSKKLLQFIVDSDSDDPTNNEQNHRKEFNRYYRSAAVMMIRKEMQTLLQYDTNHFPVQIDESAHVKTKKKDSKKKNKKRKIEEKHEDDDFVSASKNVALDFIPEHALVLAKEMLQTDYETLISEKIADTINRNIASNHEDAVDFLVTENYKVSCQNASKMIYNDDQGWITPNENSNDDDIIKNSLELEYKILRNAIDEMKKKNDKLEMKKIQVMTNGYIQVRKKLCDEIQELFQQLQTLHHDEFIYRYLDQQEIKSGNQRIQELQSKISNVKAINLQMQQNYGTLLVRKRKLILQNNSNISGSK